MTYLLIQLLPDSPGLGLPTMHAVTTASEARMLGKMKPLPPYLLQPRPGPSCLGHGLMLLYAGDSVSSTEAQWAVNPWVPQHPGPM